MKSALPVTVVCHRSGFESLGSFSALFRRSYGLPPLTYRRASAANRNNGEKLRRSSWEDGAREDSR